MKDWDVVTLRDVAEIASGITLGRKPKGDQLVKVPYLRVANVQDGRLDLREVKTIDATPAEIAKWQLRDGDLLLTEGGDLDKLGRGTCWRNELPLCIHQNHLFRVRLSAEHCDPDFVALQIASPYGKAYFLAHAKKTTGIASINQSVLGNFPLMLPALDEQRVMAQRLVTQLRQARVASGAAHAQHSEAQNLVSAAYRDAFSGCTSAEQVRIGDVFETASGTTPSRDQAAYWQDGDVPWVKTGEVAFTDILATTEAVTRRALTECRLPLLPPGTVLIAMYGQGKTRGQSAVLRIAATTNQACLALLPAKGWLPEFVQHWLRYRYEELRRLSEGRGGNQANLNGAVLKAFGIPAVDIRTQQAVARRLSALLAQAQALRIAADAQLREIEALPARLLAQAFGQSVPA
ncbi:restriction endonuclease subunit S [Ideonella sp. 4Y11]|uniref:Restriction endonuclease subunit S n=1 Tax=Ideonella aquatica TaxID=2824119 RepID=A0A940YK80_9BURK|nr:restriction endonuclease subunit S [Ideonella aquatica]MBQ0961059.1 restriction endonuclease subunit S [Ideonella aquatica]